MLIALAGLTAVPNYLYEAASIDRASEWFRFRHITLPMVWPLLLIAVLFRAIEAFRQFDLVYVLTNGGPGVSTETLSFHVYKVAFLGFRTGTASAYGILMAIVVIVLTQFYLRYLNKLKEGRWRSPSTTPPPAPPPRTPPAPAACPAARSGPRSSWGCWPCSWAARSSPSCGSSRPPSRPARTSTPSRRSSSGSTSPCSTTRTSSSPPAGDAPSCPARSS